MLDQPLKQLLTGRKKQGKTKMQKSEYPKNEKSF